MTFKEDQTLSKNRLYTKDTASVVSFPEIPDWCSLASEIRFEMHQVTCQHLPWLPLLSSHHQRLSFCAVPLLGSHTLPLISKVSITGNIAWSKLVPSSVLPNKASSLRVSLLSIAKFYRWPKPWSQQKCFPKRKRGSYLTAASSWRPARLPFGNDSTICTMLPDFLVYSWFLLTFKLFTCGAVCREATG